MYMGAAEPHGPGFVMRDAAVSSSDMASGVAARGKAPSARPVVLIASTTWWAFPARIATECAARGVAVDVLCGRGHPLLKASAVRGRFRYHALRPLRALEAAITASGATLIVPCDDRTLMHLHWLHARTQESSVRAVIEKSLGKPDAFAVLTDRAALIDRARRIGIDAPETLPVENAAELDAAIERLGLPAVLKVDGTWGGFGVAIVRTPAQAQQIFARLSRPISLGQAIKRLLVDRDAFHVLPWLEGKTPALSLQRYAPGRPANSVSVCVDGEILATTCAEAVAVQRPLGAAAVVRIVENAQMAEAAKRLARDLKLSGVFGLDFLIEEASGLAHLVEMNARATPLCHLAFGPGHDLVGGIAQMAGSSAMAEPKCVTDRDVVAYFPQAWHSAPQDPWLRLGFHDVPWEDPSLLKELLRRPWPDRGILAQLRRQFLRQWAPDSGVLATNRTMDVT